MVKRRQVEVVEIPTEQLAYIPGPHADRFATFSRWSVAWRAAVDAVISVPPIAPRSSSAQTALGTVGNAGPTFRRLIDVPGARLALVLGTWWQHAEHDDEHLRLDAPYPVGGAWSLRGAFRRTLISRWLPVELLLSPHLGPWTLLELMPRRAIHPNETYFRTGHRSLDRFVAALRTYDVLADGRNGGASNPSTHSWHEKATLRTSAPNALSRARARPG
jgi:hypothetical protein